ncbi:MAG: HNH endonuclease [Leptolyngbya sp. SIO4C5]|nr:HNH endonuclease [Leptolyngbya sp. SIO4C5]
MSKPPKNIWLMVYSRKFKYPRVWCKGIVQRILLSWAGHKCEHCGATDEQSLLHVHHLSWKAKHDCRWENLVVLCVSCHTQIHNRRWQPGSIWRSQWGEVPNWLKLRKLNYLEDSN